MFIRAARDGRHGEENLRNKLNFLSKPCISRLTAKNVAGNRYILHLDIVFIFLLSFRPHTVTHIDNYFKIEDTKLAT